MIVPYKNRLLVFAPWEGTPTASNQIKTRVRWSGIGLETNFTTGWRSDVIGYGGFADAPTNEAIISCGFVKDDLIVFYFSENQC